MINHPFGNVLYHLFIYGDFGHGLLLFYPHYTKSLVFAKCWWYQLASCFLEPRRSLSWSSLKICWMAQVQNAKHEDVTFSQQIYGYTQSMIINFNQQNWKFMISQRIQEIHLRYQEIRNSQHIWESAWVFHHLNFLASRPWGWNQQRAGANTTRRFGLRTSVYPPRYPTVEYPYSS